MKAKRRQGSAYIYTLLIVMIIFSLLSTVIIITNNKKDTLNSYIDNKNIYDIALIGIEEGLIRVNNYIYENQKNLITNTLNEMNINNGIYIIENMTNKYNGDFTFGNEFYEIYMKNITRRFNRIRFSIEIDNIDINVIVYSENNDLYIKSSAVDYDKRIETVLISEINFKNDNTYFNPLYRFKNIPEILNYKIYSKGENDYLGEDVIKNGNEQLELNFENEDWSLENPILVTQENQIDISQFYVGDSQIPTIIICKDNLSIYSSDMSKNIFNGYILVEKDLNFAMDVIVNGYIYTGQNMYSNNLLDINFDNNIIFDVKTINRELYRKILDTLKITNFKNAIMENRIENISENGDIYAYDNIYSRNNKLLSLEIINIYSE